MENINSKKIFFYLLICSIALSALMGIWAILSGEFGELQARVLGTTLTVVGTSILGLACGAFLESKYSRDSAIKIVPVTGIILAVFSALVTMWLIWIVVGWGESWIYKTLAVSIIFAFSFAQLSLLSLAHLVRRFRWATTAVYFVVMALASIVSLIIIFDPQSDDFLVSRFIGVLAVTDAALTVMIPIFHRLSRGEFAEENETFSSDKIDAEIAKLKAQISWLEKQKEDISSAENQN